MAAPGVPVKGTASAGTATSVTPSYPASVAADDIIWLLAISHQPVSIGVISLPSGFTEVAQGTYQNSTPANQGRAALFWKRAAGGESGTVSVSRTGDTGSDGVFFAQMYKQSGCATSGNPWDAVTATYGPGNATVQYGAVTVSGSERTLNAFVAQADNASTVDPPSTYTGLTTDTTATGTDAELFLCYKQNVSTDGSTTSTGGETEGWATFHVAVKPAPADQNLTASLYSNSATFYAPTVTPGAVTLSAALYSNNNTFYAPTVSQPAGDQDLTASLYSNSATFYAPTVTPGAVTLEPGLYSNTNTFHAPTVVPGAVTLEPSLYNNSPSFYGPTVTPGAVTLAPELFANSSIFYGPTIVQDGGDQYLVPALYANAHVFYAPVVAPGAVTLTPALYSNTNAFYPPTVLADGGDQYLVAALYANAQTFYAPTVVGGAVQGWLEAQLSMVPALSATPAVTPSVAGSPQAVPALSATPRVRP